MKLARPLALTLAAALSYGAAPAGEVDFPWDALPESFVGMQTGELQPKYTLRPHGGAAQTSRASSGGQTGRQTYFLGLDYRAGGSWQLGTTAILFDDAPAHDVAGSAATVTHFGVGAELKYQIAKSDRLSSSLLAGFEWTYFSRGGGVQSQAGLPASAKSTGWLWTVSLPTTYRVSDRLWLNGELGYTGARGTLAGGATLVGRASASVGAAYRASRRVFGYGSVKALARSSAAAIDVQDRGGPDFIYTLGAQVTMTPQSALDLYVTNAFSQSPAGDDLLFYPDKREPTLGVVLSYIPSGRGVGDAAPTYWPAVRPQAEGSRFAHGFTINAAHTLASDRVHTRRTARADGNWAWGVYYATDPDFQFEFTVEDYALRAGSNFRSEAVEGTRFMIGGRWQAMDEAYGHPFSLGFGVSGGRDVPSPEVGALYAEGTASKAFDWGEVAVNGRGAIYAASTLLGAGVSVRYDLAPEVSAFGEFTAAYRDDPVWAGGLRLKPAKLPVWVDLFTTNAVGLSGLGSLLSNDTPSFGVAVHLERALDLL